MRGDLGFVQSRKLAEDSDQQALRDFIGVSEQSSQRVKDAVGREYLPGESRVGITERPEAIANHFEIGGAFGGINMLCSCGCRNEGYKRLFGLRKIGRLGKHAQPASRLET